MRNIVGSALFALLLCQIATEARAQAIGSSCSPSGMINVQPNEILYCNGSSLWALDEEITSGGLVGIGSASPVSSLDLSQKTDAVALPSGTTAQRPTATPGMIRYNSSTPGLEAYYSSAWQPITAGGAATIINLGTSASVTNPQRNGDPTTGLFSPATSTVAVAVGGTQQLTVNSTGVGIGTSTLAAGLDVATNGAASVPGGRIEGTWYTGGTATTTKPQLLIEPTGTTSTAWSTSGTGIGANAASGFTGNLIDAQINAASVFKVDYQGNVTMAPTAGITDTLTIGNSSNCTELKLASTTLITSGSCSSTAIWTFPSAIQYTASPNAGVSGGAGGSARYNGFTFSFGSGFSHITNEDAALDIVSPTFNPTSGTGVFDALRITPVVNQTSTATGVTRGFYVNPTLTSAYDFRGLEVAAYTKNLLSATPTTQQEVLFNAPTLAAGSATTVTNAATEVITGAPIAGTNVTITHPYAMWIEGGNVRMDGLLGVGTVSPLAAVDVQEGITSASGVAYGTRLQQTLTASANSDNLTALYINPTFTNGSYTGVANNGLIVAAGNVGVGTASPAAGLDDAINGAASKPAVRIDGTWYTSGGTATTTKPQLLIEPSGTTSTGWYTAGTGIGINAASGFGGYLVDAQVNGSRVFYVDYGGEVFAGNGSGYHGLNTALIHGAGPLNTTGGTNINIVAENASFAPTSGNSQFINLGSYNSGYAFAPTSGAATLAILDVGGTDSVNPFYINQTSTATGVTRGAYIYPTLTSAYDFRAIETASYTHNLLGTPPTTLQQVLFNAPTLAAGSSKTVTNAATEVITGAPIAGSNVTITNPYALWVESGVSRFGGNVGVGTSSPATTLQVAGEILPGSTGVACSSTTQGALRYNSTANALQFCDGSNWNGLPATSCGGSTPTAFSFTNVTGAAVSTLTTSNIIQITGISCVVSTQITGSGSPQYQICADNACGTVITGWTSANASISSGQYVQMRLTSSSGGSTALTATLSIGAGSSTWSVTTAAYCTGSAPTVGTICSDGTMYAGLDAGSLQMFITPCDYGQTYSAGSCTGTASSKSWNNGTGGGTTTGATSTSSGISNTNTLAASSDSDSPYNAALACHNLNFGGHTDWFLPATNQLTYIMQQGTYPTEYQNNTRYWTSTEVATTTANALLFYAGGVNTYSVTKTQAYMFRCMRGG
jgi:hypothetical protein